MKHLNKCHKIMNLVMCCHNIQKNGKYEQLTKMPLNTKHYQMLTCLDDSSKTYYRNLRVIWLIMIYNDEIDGYMVDND